MQVGRYRLDAPLLGSDLGRYRAVDMRTNSPVEIRLLTTVDADSSSGVELRSRLAKAALASGPALRSIETLELDADPPHLALEWLEGANLVEQQAKQPLSQADTIRLIRKLTDALIAMHRVGFSHGAICPENIQSDDDVWKLDCTHPIDINAPEHRQSDFIAPEAARGEPEAASDVFSLATILHWLLLGKHVDRERAASVEVGAIKDDLTTIDELKPISDQLAACLSHALATDPADRTTARGFAEQLDSCAKRIAIVSTATLPSFDKTQLATSESLGGARLDQTVESDVEVVEPSDEPMPEQLGRFRIVGKLGEGGMGAVYRGEDMADGAAVAIKVLGKAVVNNVASRRRFAKEARMLAKMQSPFVANLLEFNTEDDVSYLVTEFVPGRNLAELLEERTSLDEVVALALMVDVARGLAVAHSRGIVHRDIKPDNLLLTAAGTQRISAETAPSETQQPLVKLADFGLARSLDQSESLAITRQGAVMGTPFYMPPEQCRGEATDERSDVYSMGATLFHLLAGRPPYVAKTHVAVLNKHSHDPIPSLSKTKPGIGSAIESVVEKTLAKNPDARYADAEALLVDLENLLLGKATSLAIHPALPNCDAARTLEYEFTWTLNSSAAQLWPFVANTDRLNQAMGLPPARFSTRNDPERGVRRFAETRIAGQRIAWEEHPFEWTEGRRMSVLREFSHGPFTWFVNVVELTPQVDGTTLLSHKVLLEPKNMLGRLIAKMEIGMKARRSLGRIYQQIDGFIASGKHTDPTADAFRKSAALSARRRTRLHQRIERLRDRGLDATVIDTLGQFLEHASDQEVARIRPRAFAERFDLDATSALAACLHGAREGLLVLLWDILCPSCRIPSNVEESLAALEGHGHCEACDANFELDFANSIEMIFRAHPEIRDVEVQTYCIGGPAFSAHVVAQVRLPPGERFEMELALSEGAYRLCGPQLPFAVDLRVASRGASGRCEIRLSKPTPRDLVPILRTGSQVVTLLNDGPTELMMRLERTASRADAVTAADASSFPLFGELLPGQVLSAGQMVSVATVAMLMAEIGGGAELYEQLGDGEAFDVIREALVALENCITQHGGAVVKIVGEGMIATFTDPSSAVKSGLAIHAALSSPDRKDPLTARVAAHRGPAMVTTLNDRLDYFGSTVHVTKRLLDLGVAGDLLVTDTIIENSETVRFLRDNCDVGEVIDADWCPAIVQRYCRMQAPA
ncbi:MAG: protein kinase [Planctomycetes bacterium]|nr:protein kinase [Planctomycetota bacterium]